MTDQTPGCGATSDARKRAAEGEVADLRALLAEHGGTEGGEG